MMNLLEILKSLRPGQRLYAQKDGEFDEGGNPRCVYIGPMTEALVLAYQSWQVLYMYTSDDDKKIFCKIAPATGQ